MSLDECVFLVVQYFCRGDRPKLSCKSTAIEARAGQTKALQERAKVVEVVVKITALNV